MSKTIQDTFIYFCSFTCEKARKDKKNNINSVKWSITGAAGCVQLTPLHGWHDGPPHESPRGHGLHRWFRRRGGGRLWYGWLGASSASVVQPAQPLWVTSSTAVTQSDSRAEHTSSVVVLTQPGWKQPETLHYYCSQLRLVMYLASQRSYPHADTYCKRGKHVLYTEGREREMV